MTKKAIILGVVIIFVGILIGALIVNFFIDDRMGGPHHKFGRNYKGNFKKRVIHVIDPCEEQMKEIEPIIDKYTERTSDLTEKYYEKFSATMDSMHTELEPILTEEQKERLSKRREKMKRMEFGKKNKRWKRKWKKEGNRKGKGERKGYRYEYEREYGRDSLERKWKKDSL